MEPIVYLIVILISSILINIIQYKNCRLLVKAHNDYVHRNKKTQKNEVAKVSALVKALANQR